MKITAIETSAILVKKYGRLLTFDVGFNPKIKKGEKFNITIKDFEKIRSGRQNSYQWQVISDIAKQTGGHKDDVYIGILELAGIKTRILTAYPSEEKHLKTDYRVVRKIDECFIKGVRMHTYECYIGSSKFTRKESVSFADFLKNTAAEFGIIYKD
jgi:hypothetical protein